MSSSQPMSTTASRDKSREEKKILPALFAVLSGLLFGVGLIVGGMTDPAKVMGFLDFTGAWEPALVFVMGGGVAVHFLLMQFVLKRKSPFFEGVFHLPTRRSLDRPLLVGAALFGAGWGLAGYCPGPGIVAAAAGGHGAIVFVATLIIGMIIQHGVSDPKPQRTTSPC